MSNSSNVTAAMRFLKGKGLSTIQAAAAVGAMTGESGDQLDPAAENPSSHALGIAQWLGGRKTAAVQSKQLGPQLQHLWHELNTSEKGSLMALKGSQNLNQAVTNWVMKFERPGPGEATLGRRVAAAKRIIAQGGGSAGSGTQGSAGSLPSIAIKGRVTAAHAAPDFATAAEQVLRSGTKHGLPKLGTSRLAQAQQLFKSGLATTTVPTTATQTIATTKGTTPGAATASTPTGALPKGVVDFEGHKVAAWVAEELRYARAHGWKGSIESGFRTDAEQTRIYKSGVRPAAVPKSMGGGGSNHEGADFPLGAVDIKIGAAQLSAILSRKPGGSPLKWAGAKDPVHFSHPHNGSY